MNISLLGPPGSGKGTVSRTLAKERSMAIFETGAYLRAYAREHDPELEKHLAGGGMAETPLVMRLLAQGTSGSAGSGWIIDGTPRNPEQSEEILRLWRNGDLKLDLIIVLEAGDEVVRNRLSGRSICSGCSETFNVATKPAPENGECPLCRSNIVRRQDDTDEGIAKRLRLYREMTEKGIQSAEEGGLRVARVDASLGEDLVLKSVMREIEAIEPRRRKRTPGR